MPRQSLSDDLDEYGELDLYLESGARAHVHRHDTDVTSSHVVIDSKAGRWSFSKERIEHVEYPVSEVER